MRLRCSVNGRRLAETVCPADRLLDYLRARGCTSVKEGCGEGECGACAVLLNGRLVNSCLVPLAHAEDADVLTVEGLPDDDPLSGHFVFEGGTQCGMCTPGMVLAAHALLAECPRPDRARMQEALAGNLCRCTGFEGIYRAIARAAAP